MPNSVIQTSFNAGELSPTLFARVDVDKYKSGLATMRNFFVDFRGGATSRPGSQYIAACRSGSSLIPSPRLIPFIVATTAAYVIEMGQYYLQFYYNGGIVETGGVAVVVTTPYAAADIPTIKYTQSADVMTFTHPNYPPYQLSRISATSFSFAPLSVGPQIAPPGSLTGAPSATGTVCYAYRVTAVSLSGTEESLPSNVYYCRNSATLGSSNASLSLSWNPPSEAVAYYNVYKAGPFSQTSIPASVFGYIGQSVACSFTDNNIAPDFTQTPPTFQDPFATGTIENLTLYASGTTSNEYNYLPLTITDSTGSGASGYGISNGGGLAAVFLDSGGQNYTNPAITCSGVAGENITATLSPTTGTYPAVSTYFQQRQGFGSTTNSPESVFFSQTGNYANFDVSPTVLNSDAITASLAGRQVNVIKSFVPMSTGLVTFTSGGALLISGGSPTAALTPSSISALPQGSSGANDVQPLAINFNILYIQNKGNIVRDLTFNYYLQNYYGYDRSTLSNHLFLNYSIIDWCYAEEPHRLVWATRNDGVLLSFTYVAEQEVFGWARHDTNGLFQSVCSIPEGNVNAVYFIVQRYINGGWVNCVERMAPRVYKYVADAWELDCALQWPQTFPAATLYPSAANNGVLATGGENPILTGGGYEIQAAGDVAFIASAPVFSSGQVGDVIWCGGGAAVITQFISSTEVLCEITIPIVEYLPDQSGDLSPNEPNPAPTPLPQPPGAWSIATPTNAVSGLSYLNGNTVYGIADGIPFGPVVVSGGQITLPGGYASKIVVGLLYCCQLQTLRLDAGEPTIQSKRKNIFAMNVILDKTLDLWCGPDFESLTQMQDLIYIPYSIPNPLFSGISRTTITSDWTVDGQMCLQKTSPLPANVLGIVPEFVVGDTGR